MAREPRKRPGSVAVGAARDLAAALANPAARLLVRLAGPQNGLTRLTARPPLLDVAPFGALPEAAFQTQQPPPAAAPNRPEGQRAPRPTSERRPPRTALDQTAQGSVKRVSAPGPDGGRSPESSPRRPPAPAAKRHLPTYSHAERRSTAAKASSRAMRPTKTAPAPAAAVAGLQLPVFGAGQKRAGAAGAPPPGNPAAALDPTERLTLLTDALFAPPDEGLGNRKPMPTAGEDPSAPTALPRRSALPRSAVHSGRPDGNRNSPSEGPKADGAAPVSGGTLPADISSAPVGAATAMARIATLVEALLTPPASEAPSGVTAPPALAAAPPDAPFSRHRAASPGDPPAGRRGASGPATVSPPAGWPDLERLAAATEPEDLAELINAVLVEQARRHGVDLS